MAIVPRPRGRSSWSPFACWVADAGVEKLSAEMGTVSIEKKGSGEFAGFIGLGCGAESNWGGGFHARDAPNAPGRVCVVDLRYGGAQGIF